MKCFIKCAGYFVKIAATATVIVAILAAVIIGLMVLAGVIANALGLGSIAASIIYIAELIVISAAAFTIADRKKICES
jgi:hypothetical protein